MTYNVYGNLGFDPSVLLQVITVKSNFLKYKIEESKVYAKCLHMQKLEEGWTVIISSCSYSIIERTNTLLA